MSANYWGSTQRQKWQLTRDQIQEARQRILLVEKQRYAHNASLAAPKYDINLRIYLHQLIIKLGRRFNLRQVIMSTAEVYLTRFLLSASIREVNVYLLVATCIYVACKIEESPQHIRTILTEARNSWPEFIPNDLTKLAEFEFYLIDELECYLVVHHPYNSLTEITDVLKTWVDDGQRIEVTSDELQSCWSIINDSYILDLHLLFPPHVIAVSALYLTLILGAENPKVVQTATASHTGTGSAAAGTPVGNSGLPGSGLQALPQTLSQSGSGSGVGRIPSVPAAAGLPGKTSPEKERSSPNKLSRPQQPRRLSKNSPEPYSRRVEFQQRIETFIRFLAVSNIDLEEVIESVQELLTLYDSWGSYDEVAVRNGMHAMILALNAQQAG